MTALRGREPRAKGATEVPGGAIGTSYLPWPHKAMFFVVGARKYPR